MKKKILPGIAVFGVILLIIAILGISALVKKYTPTKETKDLYEYLQVENEDDVAIIFNYQLNDAKASLIDGKLYLDYDFVHDNLNDHFYWDENENILLYSTSSVLYSASAESTSYLEGKASVDFGTTIVKANATSAYIAIDFVKQFTDFDYDLFENPNRLVLRSDFSDTEIATVKKDTNIRVLGGIKSPIVTPVNKKEVVTVLDKDSKWTKVQTSTGLFGYIPTKRLSDTEKEVISRDFTPEEFPHISKDFEICMAWHQVTNYSANSDIYSILAESKGINVISPTWFYVKDNNGNIADLGSNDYVNYCHNQNVEVWGLVSNLENPDVDTTSILTHTSTRQFLEKQIFSVAVQYDLDGINVDFESIDPSVGDAYIQFIRELSILCENYGILLSVDNYAPTDYTAFYNRKDQAKFADYVVIMGYDEHYAGSEEAGSVASIGWVKDAVTNTLEEVPASQTILGMPFYTRVWASTPDNDTTSEFASYTVTSKAYGMNNAYAKVANNGASASWDEESGQNYASWTESDGTIYQVWLEDSQSAEKRLAVMDENKLAGAAFWKLGFEDSDIWDTIIKYVN